MGVYISKNDLNPNNFTFLKDSTFSYDHYGSSYKHSSGRFKIRDGQIILNSNIRNIDIPIEFSIYSSDSLIEKNRIAFKFKDLVLKQEDYKCIAIINKDTLNNNDWLTYITQDILNDKWGDFIIYYTEPIDSVQLQIWRSPFIDRPRDLLSTKTIYFDNLLGKNVVFNISINDSLFGYRVFNNEILEVKRGKVFFHDAEENTVNKLYYILQ